VRRSTKVSIPASQDSRAHVRALRDRLLARSLLQIMARSVGAVFALVRLGGEATGRYYWQPLLFILGITRHDRPTPPCRTRRTPLSAEKLTSHLNFCSNDRRSTDPNVAANMKNL
jgi:hypothetical protein